jgi:uncharacterized membrane protein YqjE
LDQPQPSTPPPPGIAASLRALGATLQDIVATRVELAVVELREMREHGKAVLVLGVLAAIFGALGLLLAAMFVVLVFWDTHRIAAAGGVTALYLAIAAVALLRLRTRSLEAKTPFEATLREFMADRETLAGDHDDRA